MDSENVIRVKLKQFLSEHFNLSDLKDLAFSLNVDSEIYAYQNKQDFCREIIRYFEQRKIISCLIAEVVKLRQDKELANFLTNLPPCKPLKKVQIIVSKGIRGDLTAIRKDVALRLQIDESEVTIIGAAWGSMRLLISVPDEAGKLQLLSKIHHLLNDEYPVVSIDYFDDLDTSNRTAWQYIVKEHPPIKEENTVLPSILWEDALGVDGERIDVDLKSAIPEQIGRYVIKGKLGMGGMAVVYLGHDPISDRYVAVKVIKDNFSDDPNFRQRFQREIKYIANLEHPAIVPVYDVGEHENKLFLVMRIMTGGSLLDRLEQNGLLSISDASSILKRITTALEVAHAAQIVHRDIKPGNVLFDREGNTYLTDFGIASAVEQTAMVTSTLIGTPGYMAPEQWSLRGVGPYTDVYQLGIMFFEMLTGQRPFNGENLADLHMNQPVPSARAINRKLPVACDAVFEKALAKDPSDRFQTPGDLATAFSRALGEEKIGNRYEIKEEIGNGRMAYVYSAFDPQLVQDVAVKLMRYELSEGLAFRRRFNREARIITNLSHDALVPVYEVNLDDRTPYIAMRLMRGGSLRSRLSVDQPVPILEVFRIAKRVALAIDALHAENYIHRDIKPSNILFDHNDVPYLADFGLVEIAEQTQIDDHLSHSFPYFAPEQWLGQEMKGRTDIYQFGIMLFEILTGRLPFIDNTIEGFRHKHLEKDVPSAHSINSGLPPAFDMILAKAMAKAPEHRYGSAGELVQTLMQVEKQYVLDIAYTEGREFYRNDQWQEAIEAFERIISVDPEYLDIRAYLSRAKEHQYKTGIYNRGEAAYSEDRWADAIYQFQQIAGYRDAEILLAKARRQIELEELYETALKNIRVEQWVSAKNTFDRIDRLDPNYKDVDERLKTVEQAIMNLYQKGRIELNEGNLETAVQWFEKITGHTDADSLKKQAQEKINLETLYRQGVSEFKAENWNKAKDIFNQIIGADYDYKDVAFFLRQIKEKKRNKRKEHWNIERIGLWAGVLGIIFAIAFDFFGIGYLSFRDPSSSVPVDLTPITEWLTSYWPFLILIPVVILLISQRSYFRKAMLSFGKRLPRIRIIRPIKNQSTEELDGKAEQNYFKELKPTEKQVRDYSPSNTPHQFNSNDIKTSVHLDELREEVLSLSRRVQEIQSQNVESKPDPPKFVQDQISDEQHLLSEQQPSTPFERVHNENDQADLPSVLENQENIAEKPSESAASYSTGIQILPGSPKRKRFDEGENEYQPSPHTIMIDGSYEAAFQKRNIHILFDEFLELSHYRRHGDLLERGKRLILLNGYGRFGGTSIAMGVCSYILNEQNITDFIFIRVEIGWGRKIGKYKFFINEIKSQNEDLTVNTNPVIISKLIRESLNDVNAKQIEVLTQFIVALMKVFNSQNDNESLSEILTNLFTISSFSKLVLAIDRADQQKIVDLLLDSIIIDDPRIFFILITRREAFENWPKELRKTIIENYKFRDWYVSRQWEKTPQFIKYELLQIETNENVSLLQQKWIDDWYRHLAYKSRGSLADAFKELEKQGVHYRSNSKQNLFDENLFENRAEVFEHNAYVYNLLRQYKNSILAGVISTLKKDRAWLSVHLIMDWILEKSRFSPDEIKQAVNTLEIPISDNPKLTDEVLKRLLEILIDKKYLIIDVNDYQLAWKMPQSLQPYSKQNEGNIELKPEKIVNIKGDNKNQHKEVLNIGLLTPRMNSHPLSKQITTQIGFETLERGHRLYLMDRTDLDKATSEKLRKLIKQGSFYSPKALSIISYADNVDEDDKAIIQTDSPLKQLQEFIKAIDVLILLGVDSAIESMFFLENQAASKTPIIPVGAASAEASELWTKINDDIENHFSSRVHKKDFAAIGPVQDKAPEIGRGALKIAEAIYA